MAFDISKDAWIARLTIGYTEKGKRRMVKRQAKTKTEAETILRQLHETHRTGALVPNTTLTVGAWFDRWQANLPTTLAPRTVESYELTIRIHIKPAVGGRPLSGVKAAEIQELYRKMQVDKKLTRSVEITHRILAAAFSEAVRLGVLGASPMAKVRGPKTKTYKPESFHTPDETEALLEAAREADDPALLAFVLVGVETGARLSEIAGLTWANIEKLDQGALVTFASQLAREKGSWKLRRLKTDKSLRAVYLSEEASKAIDGQRLRQALEGCTNALGLALLNEIGRPWEQSHANSRIEAMCKKAKVPALSSHKAFRHSYATRALKGGATLHDTSRVLGHSTPNLTGALYGHHTLEASKRVADIGQKELQKAAERREEKRTSKA